MLNPKFLILIPDGMSDLPIKELGNKTPLEVAKTPTMDSWASKAEVGMAINVPEGMPPGSDVANLSIFGFYPRDFYTGRAPLEAANQGIELGDRIAYRCNMVTLQDGIMKDFTAGHIKTEETDKFLNVLKEAWKDEPVEIYTGKSYRNLLIAPHDWAEAKCTPPHDITDQAYEPHLPRGGCSDKLIDLMVRSQDIFKDHPLNRERSVPVSSIWLWGQGGKPQLPVYKDKFGVTGVVISAVDLLKGIARLTGLEVIDVPGATGFIDTNYEGKAHAALEALKTHDMVLIHLESTDETGHMGDTKLKIQSIEDCDKRVFSILKSELEKSETPYHILLMPDHPTPISLKTHTSDPVPYLLYRSDDEKNSGLEKFSESSVGKVTENNPIPGHELTNKLLKIL